MARLPQGVDRFKAGYRLRFTVGAKRFAVYGKTVRECKDKEIAKREEIKKGLETRGRNQTVDNYFKTWDDNRRGTVKGNTLRTNRSLWNMIKVVEVGGKRFDKLKLSEVQPDDIRALQRGLVQTHSTRTTNDCISMVKSIFKTAVDDRMLTWNPCTNVKRLKRTEETARDTVHRALSRDETKRFMQEAESRDSYYLPLFQFLLHTGCRIGEAGAITANDISGNELRVERTITRSEVCAYEVGKDAKTTAGRRKIPLRPEALEAIKTQKKMNAILQGKVKNFRQLLFVAPRGGLIKSENVSREMSAICDAIGIERITPHSFRATFATRCIESNMPVKTLQEILGHSDIKMTLELYNHVMKDAKIASMKVVGFY